MITIKCLFWNINKKNLVQELIQAVLENNINIVMLAEGENFDMQYFISALRRKDKVFEKKEILDKRRGIMLFAHADIAVSVYKEEKYFSLYKVHEEGKNYLLAVVHLISPMHYSELARNQRANDLSKIIEKLEQSCNLEAEQKGERKYSTVIAGDFNLHPFSAGIIGMHGFNAIMDSNKALKNHRVLNGENVNFYFNPMWNLMGKRNQALGTYYFETDQDDNSFFWYTFDQIFIRPELIEDFIWEDFQIIDQIGNDFLIRNNKIYSKKYSDHLPIKFTIEQRRK